MNATSLSFGENSKLSAIPEAAFKGCNNIANNVIIPKTVETIGDEAFASVWAPSFTFEEGSVLTTIGVRAFGSSSTMTSISLPESVTSIGMNAFMWCSNLEDFHYQGTIEQWALVSKGSNWNNGIKATVVHCSDGDVAL